MSKILANQIANYGDDSPIELKEGLNIPVGKPLQAAGESGTNGQVLSSTGSTVAWVDNFSGSYNDLSDRPTIPAPQVQSDWNAVGTLGAILNKPPIPPLPSVTLATPGSSTLTYNQVNGEFTFTPPDLSGYLTSYTETDPVFSASPAGDILTTDITNWDTAYGWGNHATAGYLTSLDIEDLGNVDIAGGLSDQQVLKWDAATSSWKPANDLVGGAQGIAFTDLSVSTAAAGTAALAYNNTNGVFTYTPPDLSGYLTSYTETDPVFSASAAAGITSAKINQWDTSYSWGNHADGGYLTAETDTLDTVTGRGYVTTNTIQVGRVEIGSNSLSIDDVNNNLELRSNTGVVKLLNSNSQNSVTAGGDVYLYSNGSTRLNTTSAGVTVSGNLTVNGSADINIGTEALSIFGLSNEAYVRNLDGTGAGGAVNIQGRSGSYLWTGGSYVGVGSKSTGEGALYYQSAEKLTATNTGVTVTGDLNFTGVLRQGGSLFFPIANATISDTAPGSPNAGDLWWESDKGRLKIYYNDTDSTQWVDASPPLSVDNIDDVVTANGFKFRLNESTPPAGTLGEIRQIDSRPHFYDGTNWQEFILASTEVATIPAETAWDNVILRTNFDNDVDDIRFGQTGVLNYDPSVVDSSRVASPVKFGTNALKSVGDGVEYAHRSEYDFTGEFTIECWIYFDSANIASAVNSGEQIVISKNSPLQTSGWSLFTKIDQYGNRTWWFRYYDTSTSNNVDVLLESISGLGWGQIYPQTWVHIALTRDSNGALHWYRDGVQDNITSTGNSFANGISNTTDSILFGGSKYSANNAFDGFIDDIRVTTDVRYTSNFTPPATAHPISGATTTYTPPATSKAGEITLGTSPTWTGTLGVTVSQQTSGTYRMSFTNPFTNATDYYVFANHMDYPGGQAVFVSTNRSAGYIDFVIYRDGDGNPVDLGSLAVQVIAH